MTRKVHKSVGGGYTTGAVAKTGTSTLADDDGSFNTFVLGGIEGKIPDEH